MAIIKKVDNKNIVLADTPKIDHSQLSGTNSYGAHPISAIRKLPEKLTALKKKDEEIDSKIEDINENITEINSDIKDLRNKDAELTNNIAEVKRHARQISINYNEENKEVTFTNYDGGTNSFVVPKVDEDTLTYRDTDHITLKKVYHDETTLKGLGTEEDPLAIKYPVDEDTIKTDQENGNIYATAIKDDQSKITPEDIRNKNEQTESELKRLDTTITNLDTKVEQYQLSQQNQINDLLTRTEGMGGYLNASYLGNSPTSEKLTAYALQDIGIENVEEIYDGTKVRNLTNNHIYIFDKKTKTWSDQGEDTIIADANNDGLHGLVTGSYEDYYGFIDSLGRITINKLEEDLKSIDSTNEELRSGISGNASNISILDQAINFETDRAKEAEANLQENIDALENYSNETFETKVDANTSHTELEEKITEARGIAVKYLGTYIIGNSYNQYDLVSYGDYYYISLKADNTNAPSIGVTNENWECISINSLTTKTIQVTQDDNKLYILGDKGTSDTYQSIYRPSNVYVENNVVYDGRGKLASDIELNELYQKVTDEAVKADEETITRNEDQTITAIGLRDYINNVFKSAESLIKGTNIIVLGAND